MTLARSLIGRTMRVILIVALLLLLSVACTTLPRYTTAPSDDGVMAYRAKDYDLAWALLTPLAESGHYRAQRYMAFMLLQGNAPIECAEVCPTKAVGLLLDSARRGDNNSLIVLEGMRASGQTYAPTDLQIFKIEEERAEKGDPVMAWRLAERYRDGDGVALSASQSIHWLKIAANANGGRYPKAADAAFRLCEVYARGKGVSEDRRQATYWCRRAAKNGHSGAAIVLARFSKD